MKNDIEFPLENHSLLNHATQTTNSTASYNLCDVTNHCGTQEAGNYINLCRSLDGDTKKCNDQNVNKKDVRNLMLHTVHIL